MAEKEKEDAKSNKNEGEGDTPKAASSRSKMMIIVGVALVALIALGLGGFFAYKTFAKKNHAESTLQEATTDAQSGKDIAKSDNHKGSDNHAKSGDTKQDDHKKDSKTDAKAANDHAKNPADHASEAPKAENKDEKTIGSIYEIPKMELNVGGSDLNRGYLRVAIAIEYLGKEDIKKELESRTPQYRDIIINKVANTPKNDLLTARGREELRKSILNAINTVNTQPIKSLYFTEFLVE
jgi:flagellar basal body-associated protein FliL